MHKIRLDKGQGAHCDSIFRHSTSIYYFLGDISVIVYDFLHRGIKWGLFAIGAQCNNRQSYPVFFGLLDQDPILFNRIHEKGI